MAEPICIIGDSITGGVVYLSDSAKYTHWKDSFVNLLGASLDTEMKNHSKFGCTSGAALKRLERYSKDIAACPNTLVMLGGNDSDFNWPAVAAEPEAPHDCNTPMARFTEYYNKVLDGIQALGSKPVVINLIPVYGRRYFEWFSRKLDPKALMRFLGLTREKGHICSELRGLELCYAFSASASGEGSLTPAWLIVTDTGEFYINAITGKEEVIA